MTRVKDQIFEIINNYASSNQEQKKWLAQEAAELGLKHSALDEISLDSIRVISALFTYGTLDTQKIIMHTALDSSNLIDQTDSLEEHGLICDDAASGGYQLTTKGTEACIDLFKNVTTRKRFELKRELEAVESIFEKLPEIGR